MDKSWESTAELNTIIKITLPASMGVNWMAGPYLLNVLPNAFERGDELNVDRVYRFAQTGCLAQLCVVQH